MGKKCTYYHFFCKFPSIALNIKKEIRTIKEIIDKNCLKETKTR